MTNFTLGAGLDLAGLAARFAERKRLQIPNFLRVSAAEGLYRWLMANPDWRLTVNRGDQVVDFTQDILGKFTAEQWRQLSKAVAEGGRHNFQFCYETIRVQKAEQAGGDRTPLSQFADFLSAPAMVEAMRRLTGFQDIAFADAHASRYRTNHFLTAHDDQMETMGRRAAYVLNLTPGWRTDWGGLLLFHDPNGNIVEGFRPAFNTLNVFAVPQMHSVSWVTPLAGEARYAVTGWLRAG